MKAGFTHTILGQLPSFTGGYERLWNNQCRGKYQCLQVYICESRLVPLLNCLKPHSLSAVLALHGGSLEAAEQQPMGKIVQMWGSQVTGLLLQEVTHNILRDVCRAAIHRPGVRVKEDVECKEQDRRWRQRRNYSSMKHLCKLTISRLVLPKIAFSLAKKMSYACWQISVTEGGKKNPKQLKMFTSHIRHSFSSEDNTGRFFCLSGCQEVEPNGFAQHLSPHSCECNEPSCSSASAALR